MRNILRQTSWLFIAQAIPLLLIVPKVVYAGDPSPYCIPTPEFSNSTLTACLIVISSLFLILIAINYHLFKSVLTPIKKAISRSRLIVFTTVVTLVSLFVYYFWYAYILISLASGFISDFHIVDAPNSRSIIGVGGYTLTGPRSIFLNRITWVGFLITFLLNWFLLKLLFGIKTKKTALLSSIIIFPVIGLLIGLLLSEIYIKLFPFQGIRYLHTSNCW